MPPIDVDGLPEVVVHLHTETNISIRLRKVDNPNVIADILQLRAEGFDVKDYRNLPHQNNLFGDFYIKSVGDKFIFSERIASHMETHYSLIVSRTCWVQRHCKTYPVSVFSAESFQALLDTKV